MFSLGSNSNKRLSDKELIERYRYSYDNAYIGELYQRYSHMLFGVCLKYLKDEEHAKDMVMEVFEKVLTELKRHRVENFRTWIYSVTKNACLMKIRTDKRVQTKQDDYVQLTTHLVELGIPEHLNGESEEELDGRLMAAIETLKSEQKECIKLFFFEKASYEEIQEKTGYSYKQVKSYLQNGKRNLKNELSRNNE